MGIEELKASIKKDQETGLYSLQAIIDRHLSHLEKLKDQGMPYIKIMHFVGLDVKPPYLWDLLKRARDKAKNSNTEKATKTSSPEEEKKELREVETERSARAKEEKDAHSDIINLWFQSTRIKVPKEMVPDLTKLGITPEYGKENDIVKLQQLRKLVNERKQQAKFQGN